MTSAWFLDQNFCVVLQIFKLGKQKSWVRNKVLVKGIALGTAQWKGKSAPCETVWRFEDLFVLVPDWD